MRFELSHNLDPKPLQVLFHKNEHVFNQWDQVHRFASVTVMSGIRQHSGRDFRRSLPCSHDLVEGLIAGCRILVPDPHLCVVDDCRQDVVEFMRDRCREDPDRTHFLRLKQLQLQVLQMLFEFLNAFGTPVLHFNHCAPFARLGPQSHTGLPIGAQ